MACVAYLVEADHALKDEVVVRLWPFRLDIVWQAHGGVRLLWRNGEVIAEARASIASVVNGMARGPMGYWAWRNEAVDGGRLARLWSVGVPRRLHGMAAVPG